MGSFFASDGRFRTSGSPARRLKCERRSHGHGLGTVQKGRGHMEQIMEEDFQVIDNCLMIRLPEEVDHHRAAYICENADRLLCREDVRNVVFDFENTRFMDSSGIGIIMGRYRKISCFGGRIYAIHADRQIRRIFGVSGLEKIVEVLD